MEVNSKAFAQAHQWCDRWGVAAVRAVGELAEAITLWERDRDRLSTELRKVRHALELTDDTQKLTAEQLRESRAECERMKKEVEIRSGALVSIQMYCKACRTEYLREEIQETLDNLPWLLEDFTRFVSEHEVFMTIIAENERLRAALERLEAVADLFAADQSRAPHPRCGSVQPVTVAECEELNAAIEQARRALNPESEVTHE